MKAKDLFEEISGTTEIAGAVDGMYVIKKNRESRNEVTLVATGRDIISFDLTLRFIEETHHWELLERVLKMMLLISMFEKYY